MPDQTFQLPRDSTMQGIVTQLQTIASRMNNSGSSSGGGSTVVANPSGTASDDLTSIEIDGTIYDIPSGSGSSYDDTALRALIAAKQDALTPGTGIQISNGTISCTVQGGSGSGSSSEESGYSITSLYNNDSGLTTVGEITLSDSILDYDDLEFIVGINTSVDHSHQSYRISSKYFYDYFKYGTQHSDDHFMVSLWYDMACGFTLGQNNDPTKINFYDMYAGNSRINTALYSINGIKYGSSGNSVLPSGSGYEATLIYDGSALSSLQSSIELDDRWDNYDALYLTFKFGGDSSTFGGLLLKEQLLEALNHTYTAIGSYTSNYVDAHVVNDYKTFNQIYGGGNQQQNIYAVYGINFGSGGSSSSGEPYSRTELFKSATPQSGVISLSDAIDNYDDIEIVMGWVAASDTASHTERFNTEYFVTNFPYVANPTNANSHALLEMWASNGFSCAVGDATNTALQTWGHNGSSGILAVYGIKYGSSGGERISDLIYEASSTSIVDVTTTKSMTNYDYIIIEADERSGTYINTCILLKDEIEDAITNGKTVTPAYLNDTYRIYCTIDDDTTITLTNASNMYIRKVYGVKEGSGSSSSQEEYSTTEKVVGKWIDGKPLYQKTVYSASLGTGMKVPIAHGISNLGTVVGVDAVCFDSGTENAWFPLSHISTDGYNIGVFSVDGTNINFSNPAEFGSRIINVYATIKYTKTTD